MQASIRSWALAAALVGPLAGAVGAQADATLPPVQRAHGIEYLSGGIGKDESTAFQSAGRQWPLMLQFAVHGKQGGEYAANVSVLIRDRRGHEVLRAVADGPYLLARLAPGRYKVEARLAGKPLQHSVTVRADHPARAVFLWPEGTGG